MEFRTSLPPIKQSPLISIGDSFVTIGSCFANSIDQKLGENKFPSLNNPLGILYDPVSIARVLTYAVEGTRPEPESYYSINDAIVNLEAHSDMSGTTQEEASANLDTHLQKLASALSKAKWLIITLGTSWVYTHKEKNLQVANCHKIPQKEFHKSLLSHQDTQPIYDVLVQKLKTYNPTLNLIITVSPVRHLKDTMPLNNLSKSHLLILSHYLNEAYPQVHYYPSYELVIDDLRDYRFYKTDMLHPTDQAIDYIWEHFTQSFFDKKALDFLKDWDSIRKALQHRPFNPSSPKHQQFVRSTLDRLKGMDSKVDVSGEMEILVRQLTS